MFSDRERFLPDISTHNVNETSSVLEEKKLEQEKSISEIRIELLVEAIKKLPMVLTPEEFSLIEAIILFGSTARGLARAESDVDLMIASAKTMKNNLREKIIGALQPHLPDVDIDISTGNIAPKSGAAVLVTRTKEKDAGSYPKWKYLYLKRPELEKELDTSLTKTIDTV